jgi:hypothetical protein
MLTGEQEPLFNDARYAAEEELGSRKNGPRDPVAVPTDERYTPEPVLQVVRKVGPIAYDPCTTPWNHTRARRFTCLPQNGLDVDWLDWSDGGLIFCNPPYSRGCVDRWVQHMLREAKRGAEIISLTSLDLSTGWGQSLLKQGRGLCFWKGRIPYIRPDAEGGVYDSGAKQPSLFTYFGHRPYAFYEAFNPRGAVLTRGCWG